MEVRFTYMEVVIPGHGQYNLAILNNGAFRIFGKGFSRSSKNRPACYDPHIGPEENYI
jgi:hypothetical protein